MIMFTPKTKSLPSEDVLTFMCDSLFEHIAFTTGIAKPRLFHSMQMLG